MPSSVAAKNMKKTVSSRAGPSTSSSTAATNGTKRPAWRVPGAINNTADHTARTKDIKKKEEEEKKKSKIEERKKQREARSKPWMKGSVLEKKEKKVVVVKKEEVKKEETPETEVKEEVKKMQEQHLVRVDSAVSLMAKLAVGEEEEAVLESENWAVLGGSDEEDTGSEYYGTEYWSEWCEPGSEKEFDNVEELSEPGTVMRKSAYAEYEELSEPGTVMRKSAYAEYEDLSEPGTCQRKTAAYSEVAERSETPVWRLGGRTAGEDLFGGFRPSTPDSRVVDMMDFFRPSTKSTIDNNEEQAVKGCAVESPRPMTPDEEDRPIEDVFNVAYDYTCDRSVDPKRGPGYIVKRRDVVAVVEPLQFSLRMFEDERCATPVVEEEEDDCEVKDPWGDVPEDLGREVVWYSEELWPEHLRV